MPGMLALLALAVLAALAARAEAGDSEIEDTATVTWSQMALIAATSVESDFFTPRPVLRVAGNGRMMVAFNYVSGPVQNPVQNPYYSEYDRGTGKWGSAQAIHQSRSDLRYVTLAFDSANRAHAVWRDEHHVYYAAESGWPTASKTLPSNDQLIIDPPAMAIGPDNIIHVVWAQGENTMSVYHTFSADGGNSWMPFSLISPAGRDTSAPSVAVTADGSVHVVWEDYDFGTFQVFYRKGTRQGSSYSWGSTTLLSSSLTSAKRPTLIADGDNLHLGFTRQDSQYEQYAYYLRFTAGGGWGSLVNINPGQPLGVNINNPYFLNMSLAVCGGNVHVTFHGAAGGQVSEQLWSASSANNWQGVSAVTPYGTRYIHPSIACNNGVLALGVERVSAQGIDHDVYGAREEKRSLLPMIRGGR